MNLTKKQIEFAFLFVELDNATEAYRRAYDAENMNNKSISVAVAKLKKDPRIKLVIDRSRERMAIRHDVTVDSLTEEYEEARQVGRDEGQAGAMVSATTGKGKLHGVINDKSTIEISGKDGGPLFLWGKSPE